METTKVMIPSFDQVTSMTDSKEFMQNFCNKALELFEEFKREYGYAIEKKKFKDLDAITHKISSTLKWLNLDEFIEIMQAYKDVPKSDKLALQKILEEVLYHSSQIEESLRTKLSEL